MKAYPGWKYWLALPVILVGILPTWMTAQAADQAGAGAKPVSVHLILDVDMAPVVERALNADLDSVLKGLDETNISYLNPKVVTDSQIQIQFSSQVDLEQAKAFVQQSFPQLAVLPAQLLDFLHLRTRLMLQLSKQALSEIQTAAVKKTAEIVGKRLNALNQPDEKEMLLVKIQNATQIAVNLSGNWDLASVKQILDSQAAALEMHLLDTEHDSSTALTRGNVPGSSLYSYEGKSYLLYDDDLLANSVIVSATADTAANERSVLKIQISGDGEAFSLATRKNIGQAMAAVYVQNKVEPQNVDGRRVNQLQRKVQVLNIAIIKSALGNKFQIVGFADLNEASNIVTSLNANSLPVSIAEKNITELDTTKKQTETGNSR